MSTLRFVNTRGQGYSLTFNQGLSYCDNFKHFVKATDPSVTKSHVKPPGTDGTKISSNLSKTHDQYDRPYLYQVCSNDQLDIWPVYLGERFRTS